MSNSPETSNDSFHTLNENPLIDAIEALLLSRLSISSTEHQLIGQLVENGFINDDYGRDPLTLFQSHFLTLNALYQLQQRYWDRNQFLHISALNICLHKTEANQQPLADKAGALADSDTQLRLFYLNWDNFKGASSNSVEKLLDSFWRKFVAQDKRHEALSVLELEEPVSYAEIKISYRRKAMELHPDRGGCDSQLAELNEAWSLLRRYYKT